MSIIELFSFTASNALLDDVAASSNVLNCIRGSEGCSRAMLGYAIEDNTRAYLFSSWDAHSQCEIATTNPKFRSLLQPLLVDGSLETFSHVLPDQDCAPALKAPITEISTFKMKTPQTAVQDEMDSIIAEIKTHTPRAVGIHAPIVWGRPGGDKGAPSVMLIGWNNVDDHWNANKLVPVDSLIAKLFALVDIKVMHINWSAV